MVSWLAANKRSVSLFVGILQNTRQDRTDQKQERSIRMNIAVIFAGGVGIRMASSGVPKQFLMVYDKPILIHTLEKFQYCDACDAIVLACVESHLDYARGLAQHFAITKLQRIVPGGATGQASIYAGLQAAAEISKEQGGAKDVVLIHDGVRPLITSKLIEDNITAVREHGSCITCAGAKETVVVVDADHTVQNVAERATTKLARAPQSFFLTDILEAHQQADKDGLTDVIDSCTLMAHYGKALYTLECESQNIKITTPDDYFLFKALLELQQNAAVFEYPLGQN